MPGKKAVKKNVANYDLFNPNKKVRQPAPVKPVVKDRHFGCFAPPEVRPVFVGQHLYIRPSYIVSMPEYYGSSKYESLDFKANQANLQEKHHGGVLSSKAIGKMRNAINWLLCAAEDKKVFNKKLQSWFNFKVNFITLTLPDTSTEIKNTVLQKQLLNPFLTYMRTYCGLKNYVWKLEFQKNGKLHVHFIADVFIHHSKVRAAWNSILGKNNFLIDFSKKHGHSNPNSTDVHSVRKIKNLAAYLVKYMSKQDADLSKIKGRIWGCNRELSKANKTRVFIEPHDCKRELQQLMSADIEFKKLENENPVTKIKRSFAEIFFVKYSDWQHTLQGRIKEAFNDTVLFLKNVAATNSQLLEV